MGWALPEPWEVVMQGWGSDLWHHSPKWVWASITELVSIPRVVPVSAIQHRAWLVPGGCDTGDRGCEGGDGQQMDFHVSWVM